MTTAQIIFSFVAAALMLAGGWIYFRGGPLRHFPAMVLLVSGWYLDSVISGENPYYIFFLWSIAMVMIRLVYIHAKRKMHPPKPEEDEQPQPSGS